MKSLLAGALLALSGTLMAQTLVMDAQGLMLRAADGRPLDRLDLQAERWDQRRLPDGRLAALLQDGRNGHVVWVEAGDGQLRERARWRPAQIGVEAICLYRDAQGLLQGLLLGEEGLNEQWLLEGGKPQLLRRFASPVAKACAVRDEEAALYLLEEDFGLWKLAADAEAEGRELLLRDAKADEGLLRRWLAEHPQATARPALPWVRPSAQTAEVPNTGDAADDPAIWVHAKRPARSRVLGTDKKGGLGVYDLQGRQLQYLEAGRLNNVDLRQGLRYESKRWDLAVATQRDEAGLVLFEIAADGRVREAARFATGLSDVYGVCSARNAAGRYELIVNDKDGRFEQHELLRENGRWRTELRRRFAVASQPEGCVADEAGGRLFVGEEDAAIWAVPLAAEQPATPTLVAAVGPWLHADIEGLAVYRRGTAAYLIASSQGNDSYAVFDLEPPFRHRGSFRVGLNLAAGIDAVSETDGLELSSANLGGIYAEGLLVVQDGRKNLPSGRQNYKLVPWRAVRDALKLD